MHKRLWLVLIPTVAVGAVVLYAGLAIWGGVDRKASSILRRANRVEVFRVEQKQDKANPNSICGYPILAVGREQGPEFAAKLGRVLRRWGVARSSNKCGMWPGVAFRIWDGDRAVEVLLCFKCDDLQVHVVGENDLNSDYLDFGSERRDLLALAKQAFPDDPEIQALPDKANSQMDPPTKRTSGTGATSTEPKAAQDIAK